MAKALTSGMEQPLAFLKYCEYVVRNGQKWLRFAVILIAVIAEGEAVEVLHIYNLNGMLQDD